MVSNPEQIITGDIDVLVAQSRTRNGLLRSPFIEVGGWKRMKIKYDTDADILLITLRDNPPVDAIEEPGGIIVSYGEDGEPVSVEFLNASVRRLIRPDEVSVTLQTKGVLVT